MDLAGVEGLSELALLRLQVAPSADLRPLLDCPRLTRVDIQTPGALAPAQWSVLEALAARGVHVDQLLPDPATLAEITPLELLPADEVAALRARGVDVSEL